MNREADQEGRGVRVFRAGAADLPFARQAVGEVHGRQIESDEALAAFLQDESRYLYVAVADGEVVGSLNGYALTHPHTTRPQFLLYEIDVRESWRRRGVGSGLIGAFRDAARERGAFGLWVVTDRDNEAAMALYRGCGMTTSDLQDVVFSLDPRREADP